MAEVLLFHHAHGLTSGMRDFADVLRQSGHTVHVPDLYQGRVFETLEQGLAYAGQVGFETVMERGRAAAKELPGQLVYAGFSLGVMAAQMLAQTRAEAKGALLFHSCIPVSEFSAGWPQDVPVQIHAMEDDPFFVEDGDIDAARGLAATAAEANLFLYSGHEHLFADNSLPSYDEPATRLLIERVLAFLEKV